MQHREQPHDLPSSEYRATACEACADVELVGREHKLVALQSYCADDKWHTT